MYKMVIFDLDGTLLNTLDDLANAGNYALKAFSYPTHNIEKFKLFIGNGIPKLIERMLPENTSDSEIKKVHSVFSSYYNEHMNDETVPYNGVVSLLENLKKQKIKLAVVTNKADEFAGKIVERYFGKLIDNVYGSVEGLPKKPDPYWVEKAISDSGFSKDEILYVGDSGVDMETAANAGIASCGVLWGFRGEEELKESGAVYICNSCDFIQNLVLNFQRCN